MWSVRKSIRTGHIDHFAQQDIHTILQVGDRIAWAGVAGISNSMTVVVEPVREGLASVIRGMPRLLVEAAVAHGADADAVQIQIALVVHHHNPRQLVRCG